MQSDTLLVPGRMAFAVTITGFGVLSLGYVDFVSALQPVPAGVPGHGALALLTGAILLAAGLAILAGFRMGAAARVLIVFLISWIVLLHVPSAFLQPSLLRSPWWIRTFETLALTGGGLILAGLASTPTRASWIRAGGIAFGAGLPVYGVLHLVYPESVAALVPPWYPWPMFWAYFTGIAQIAAGIAIVVGIVPRRAATLAGVMYGAWALTLHIPRNWCRTFGPCELLPEVGAPGLQAMRPELTSLFVAIGMCGTAWIVAGSWGARTSEPTDRKGGEATGEDGAYAAGRRNAEAGVGSSREAKA